MRHALIALALLGSGSAFATDYRAFGPAREVSVRGYTGDVMEPFVTRDGATLLFNSSNDVPARTDLFRASRVDDWTFVFKGALAGANSSALDAVASVDQGGIIYFISARSYASTLSTLHQGRRLASGAVDRVGLVPGVSTRRPGFVDFDAEISADGQSLYVVEGDFQAGGGVPRAARMFIAKRTASGFAAATDSAVVLGTVNRSGFNYAPCRSVDGLELFWTRALPGVGARIYRATRTRIGDPWDTAQLVMAAEGFVEAPALSPDGRTLYFHRRTEAGFRLFAARR